MVKFCYVGSMDKYSRNNQLYLAERLMWQDRHVTKLSVRSLLKILAYNTSHDENEKRMCKVLVQEGLLQYIPNVTVLNMEGFFQMNMTN